MESNSLESEIGTQGLTSIIAEKQAFDLLVSKIALEASKINDDQAQRLRNRTAAFASVLVVALVGTFGFGFEVLRNTVQGDARDSAVEALEAALNNYVKTEEFDVSRKLLSDRLDEQEVKISTTSDTVIVMSAINDLSGSEGFTTDEAMRIIDGLNSIADNGGAELSHVQGGIRAVVLSFLQADRRDFVEALSKKYQEFLEGGIQIVELMLQDLAISLISSPTLGLAESGRAFENDLETLEEFNRYSKSAHKLGYPEASAFYEALIYDILHADPEISRALVKKFSDLTPDERDAMVAFVEPLFTGSWRMVKDHQSETVTSRSRQFVKSFAADDTSGILDKLATIHEIN